MPCMQVHFPTTFVEFHECKYYFPPGCSLHALTTVGGCWSECCSSSMTNLASGCVSHSVTVHSCQKDYKLDFIRTHPVYCINLSMSCNTVKTFVLLQPYFGHLSCMPVVCMIHYKTSKGCFLFESKLKCSWEVFPSIRISIAFWLHSWHLYHNHATKTLLQGQMCRIKGTPISPESYSKAFWKEIII